MIHQEDPVGLVTFDTASRASLPRRWKRTQLGSILAVLANLKPSGKTDTTNSLQQLAALMRGKSLVMLFSDLLNDEPAQLVTALHRLRHAGHEVILFHILDAAEAKFPFAGATDIDAPDTRAARPP